VEAAGEREVRKLVTVFFCDASGSTALGEQLDPELLRRVIRRYFEAIEQVIVAHGGLVEKFAGDAVMAVFGLPQAHEDDALRAVKAAAEVHERLPALAEETGFELAFRTGINSGEVVAGSGQTLATGDAVNLAARLEQAAKPGEILLGEETARLLGPAVEAEPLTPLQLRGKARPVKAFRFRSLAAGSEREHSLFVGRERELALLREGFRRACEERELHLFTLLGPAGIGKSRLAAEFAESLHGQAQVARGRCLSYGQAITYWPLVELLPALGEPAEAALERVVLGGATSPQELAWTVQRALEEAAAEQPLLVVLEDLHWAEPALLDLLDLISDLSRGYPILLLCLARPELLEERPGWAGGKLNAASVLLEPLSAQDCDRLITLRRPLDPGQRKRVVERAAGNPLFLEELTEFVAEGGDGELPPRIHVLLQARLDRLPEPERLVLACAAIEGTVFHRGRLQTLVPADLGPQLPTHLAALTRKLLIRPARAELEGEDVFHFRHQLIRDTAYGAIPKGERARLHERFADWLNEHAGERSELEEIDAYHLEQAALAKLELGTRDPALDARAASALAVAGERADLRADLRAAASFWRRALFLLDSDDARAPEVELELALALTPLGKFDEAKQLLEQADQRAADPCVQAAVRLVRLLARLVYAPDGVPAAIRRACTDAIPLFEQAGDHRRLARAWYARGEAEWVELQVQAATEAYANAAAHARLAGDRALEALALAYRTHRLALTRIPYGSAAREAERLTARFPGEPAIQALLGMCRAYAAFHDRRREQARTLAAEALDRMRRAGYTLVAAIITVFIGRLEQLGGDVDQAEHLALAGIRELEKHNASAYLSRTKPVLAAIRVAQGRYSDALELADEAERLGGPNDRITLIGANTARACAQANLGWIEEAKAAATTAVAIADTTDSIQHRADAHYALAETLAAAEEFPVALAAAEEADRLYTTLERTLQRQQVTALVEQIESAIAQGHRADTGVLRAGAST